MQKEMKSSSISNCNDISARKIQPNGSNVILKGSYGKPIMVFLPASSQLRVSGKAVKPKTDSLVVASVKSQVNTRSTLTSVNNISKPDDPPVQHEKSIDNFPLDLSYKSRINPLLIKLPDSPIDLSIKETHQLSKSLVESLTRIATKKSPNVEEPFYETSASNKHLHDSGELLSVPMSELPPLPDEAQNLPIHVKYDNISNQTFKVYSEEYFSEDSTGNKKMELEQCEDEISLSEDIILQPNGTAVNRKLFNAIKWKSASTATRKLLSIIFSPKFLAKHSLTGRPSPAFVDRQRPLKQPLNPEIIEDIMYTVKSRTSGTDREIRIAITTKCADSAKKVRALKNRFKLKK